MSSDDQPCKVVNFNIVCYNYDGDKDTKRHRKTHHKYDIIIIENHIYCSLRGFACGGFHFALQKFNDMAKKIPKAIE